MSMQRPLAEQDEVALLSAAMAEHQAKTILALVAGQAAILVREDPLRAGYLTAPARLFVSLLDREDGLCIHILAEFQSTPSVHIDGYVAVRHEFAPDILACLTAQENFRLYFLAPGETVPYMVRTIPWTTTERRYVTTLAYWIGQVLLLADQPIATKIAWGAPDEGPVLVFLPPTGGAVPLPDAPTLTRAANWNTVVQSDVGPDTNAIAALLDNQAVVSFLWPRRMDPFTALRAVVDYEAQAARVVPWPLLGAIYAALQARRARMPKQGWDIPVRMLLGVVPDAPVAPVRCRNRADLRALVPRWPGHLADAPANPYDLACYLWDVGKQAWTPTGPVYNTIIAGSLALAVKVVESPPWHIEIPGAGAIHTADEHPLTLGLLWNYFLVFRSAPITPDAVAWLLPERAVPPLGRYPIEEAILANVSDDVAGPVTLPLPADQNLLVAWADSLTAQAQAPDQTQDEYAPIGPFRVPIAPDTLLAAWGVAEMRLWLETNGLWASLVTPDQRAVVVLRWEPTGIPGDGFFMVPRWATPGVQLFLAGLWLDLHRAGPPSFPRQAPAATRRRRRGAPAAAATAPPPVQGLPYRRRVPWNLGGESRAWGTPQEQTTARQPTSSHYVRGHRRLWVYEAEWRACPVQAVQDDPPLAAWTQRLLLSWGRAAREHIAWWTGLITAAEQAQQQPHLAHRLAIMDQALTQLAAQHPQLERWAAAGQAALAQVRARGAGPVLAELGPTITAQRHAAIARATAARVAAPPEGMTFVQPYLVKGSGGTPADHAPVVAPEGLSVVAALLHLDNAVGANTPPRPPASRRGPDYRPGCHRR